MKALLAFLISIAAGLAQAGTITLAPQACGALKQCIEIPNDDGVPISIYGAPGYPYFYVTIGETLYYSSVASGMAFDNVELQSFTWSNGVGSQKIFTGQLATLNGGLSVYRTCQRSGRANSCTAHWQFGGGTLVMP